jgi:putative CocE/NonD family hydrolase
LNIVIERDVRVQMRDGVALYADVYRPAEGRHPALIHRLPYGKGQTAIVSTLLLDPIAAVERGYAVVVQDTRATGKSEGLHNPVFQERDDGHDTIDWTASQDWCDGTVGIYGSSYMGVTALQATVDAPEALKASLAYITSASFHDTWVRVGGAFELGFQLRWSLSDLRRRLAREAIRDPEGSDQTTAARAYLAMFAEDQQRTFESTLDLNELPGPTAELIPWFGTFRGHGAEDPFWSEVDVTAAASRVRVPVLSIAAWHDAFLKSGLDLYARLREESPSDVRNSHRLIVGPWDHQSYFGMETLTRAGSRDFGLAAAGGQLGLQSSALDWFDRWLKGAQTLQPQVRYFSMGDDVWLDAPTWPPLPTEEVRYYLHSAGDADVRAGALTTERPSGVEPDDSYVYDPMDPAPTHGGRHLIHYCLSGVQDQRQIQERPDVVHYVSPVLTEKLLLLGRSHVELHYETSAPSTDFFAVVVDVHPDGRAENVVEGIVRIQQEGTSQSGRCEIDLWHSAYTFPVGHRIGLQITSSCFPRFDRNRNVAPGADSAESQPAAQRIKHATALVLSVQRPLSEAGTCADL